MIDTAHREPSQRGELNGLIVEYARAGGLSYGESWREFERRFLARFHVDVWVMKNSYCQDHGLKLTMPAFLEESHWLEEALVVAREMIEPRVEGETE